VWKLSFSWGRKISSTGVMLSVEAGLIVIRIYNRIPAKGLVIKRYVGPKFVLVVSVFRVEGLRWATHYLL